jgi:tRNA threonylcarbamoyladenosine biosynthesis protein TsaE
MTQNNHPETKDKKTIAPASVPSRDNRLQPPPSAVVDFVSHSISQTQRCGSQLAQHLTPGVIILLEGDLGAGKTTFTKGIAYGLGVEGYVNSPTFTLVNEYEGRLPVYHLDCYRLESGREALDFGIEEYLYGDGVTIIEWPERISDILPSDCIRVSMSYLTDTKRSLRLEPIGSKYVSLMQEFKKSAFGSTL